MQKHGKVFSVILFGVSVFGCTSNLNTETNKIEYTRISVAEAEILVRDWNSQEYPDIKSETEFPLEEITTDEIWVRLHVQIFRRQDNVGTMTYAIAYGGVDVLGNGFGGFGVTSMVVADLDSDKHPELLFTYSFGSGLHRSHVAVYFPDDAQPHSIDANLIYMHGDLILEKIDDQTVNILLSSYDWEKDEFVPETNIGQVFLKESYGQEILIIKQNTNLPTEIRERLTTP